MASFDFVEAAARGYEFVWKERSYILHSSLPVLAVKFLCLVIIYLVGAQNKYLLNGLIGIPAHIIEAVFIVGITRYIVYKEPIVWRFGEGRSDVSRNAFKAGVAMYLLIKMVQLGFSGFILDYSKNIDPALQGSAPDPTLVSALIVMFIVAAMLWAFRLNWLYIPVAMGYSFTNFLGMVKGMNVSLSIFATWFICYLPLVVMLAGVFRLSNLLLIDGTLSQAFIQDVVRVAGELILIVVQMAAMTYGFTEILMKKKSNK